MEFSHLACRFCSCVLYSLCILLFFDIFILY
jgi:hypothetical protein